MTQNFDPETGNYYEVPFYSENSRPGQIYIEYPSGHNNDIVASVCYILHDFFIALENNAINAMLPDPDYKRFRNKAIWTKEELDKLIKDIDNEFTNEITHYVEHWKNRGYTKTPSLSRLTHIQRLALAQRLDMVIHNDEIRNYYLSNKRKENDS